MTDRTRSFADMLSPQQIRQYMQEFGYEQPQQPQGLPLPVPMDVPSQPPPQLVEFRGTIEFQAHWELPAVTNRSRDDLIGDVMGAIAGQEAPWLPRLRYHVSQLTRIDPNARPMPQAVDPRPIWKHPATGATFRVNPDGSLQPSSETPPQTTPNGWMAAPNRIPPAAKLELDLAMALAGREEHDVERRFEGLEKLAASLSAQLDDLEAQRSSRREARRQRRVHPGDLPADEDGAGTLPDTPVPPDERDSGGGGRGPAGDAAHAPHPGDGDGGRLVHRAGTSGEAEAQPDRDDGGSTRRQRRTAQRLLEERIAYAGSDIPEPHIQKPKPPLGKVRKANNATSLPESE